MAFGGILEPPYNAVLFLAAWVHDNRGLIRGRLTLAGINPDRLGLVELTDMAHVLIVEGSDPGTRAQIEAGFENAGHELRCDIDPAYKRATWGRRPEDVEALKATMGDVQGKR